MIVHFVLDEKVTDQIIENFRKVDNSSIFIVFVENWIPKYRHITSDADYIIQFITTGNINQTLASVKPKAILMHAFHLEFAKAILLIDCTVTIAWYMWGFDVYGLPRIKPHTYAPLTNAFLLQEGIHSKVGRIILKYRLSRKIYHIIRNKEDRYSILFKAMKRTSYFVTYLKEDYEYFSKFYPNTLKFIYCPFSTINQYLGGDFYYRKTISNTGQNVLIGNSCSPESNHLDCLEKLNSYDKILNSHFYTPLSYGMSDEIYKQKVIEKGHLVLGTGFVPMLDFMSREEYITILESCSTGIFYHYRQQAMGNIIAMLYLGARIYLSGHNPAFGFFVKNNIVVFDFDKDFEKYRNSRLEKSIVIQNRENLERVFNESTVLSEIKNLVNTLS